MSTPLKSFNLTSTCYFGQNTLSLNAGDFKIPIGSKLLLSPNTNIAEEVFVINSVYSDGVGSLNISENVENTHYQSSEVWIIQYPNKYYKPIDNNCPVVFEDGSFSYRNSILIPDHKPFTFNFYSEEAFNNFNILDFGSHKVEKSFPVIKITPSLTGPRQLVYKSFNEFGLINLHDNCESELCSNLQVEYFTSNDDIKYFHEVEKYLINCGKSTFSQDIIDVQALHCNCENQISYLVTYCCNLEKDIDTTPCLVSWTYECSDNSSISFPVVSCGSETVSLDSWVYSEESGKLEYTRFSNFCFDGCDSLEVEDFLLIEPNPPTESQIADCELRNSQDNTETTNNNLPTIGVDNISIDISAERQLKSGIFQCYDKPYSDHTGCLSAISKVIDSPNPTDLNNRSFYKLTENGFFYEAYTSAITSNSYPKINNFNILLNKTSKEEYDNLNFPLEVYKHPQNFMDNKSKYIDSDSLDSSVFNTFMSVVDFSQDPDIKIIEDNNKVSDQSLFHKFFNLINKDNSWPKFEDYLDFTFCQLNWKYWMKELPSLIYGKSDWYIDLDDQFFPKFKINNNPSDLSLAQVDFESSSNNLSENIINDKYIYDKISLLKFSNLPSVGFFENVHSFNDPNFNVDIRVASDFVTFSVTYTFNPDPTKISSNYLDVNLPIERTEEVTYFLQPTKNIEKFNYLPKFENFALDVSHGILKPKYKLLHGYGAAFFDHS